MIFGTNFVSYLLQKKSLFFEITYIMNKDKKNTKQTCCSASNGKPDEQHKKIPQKPFFTTFEIVPAITAHLMKDLIMEHARSLFEKKPE